MNPLYKLVEKKNWNSLTQVRGFLLSNMPEVEIIDFLGYKLITNYGIIYLNQEGLNFYELQV